MTHLTGCRSCGNDQLSSIAKLNRPVSASKPSVGMTPTAAPCDELVFCPACSLVQLDRAAAAQSMTSQEPTTRTSTNDPSTWSARHLTRQLIASQRLRPTSLVMEIGSRDGRLLSDYLAAGIPVLGIEPAVRQAELARLEYGVPTLCRHFDRPLAVDLALCTLQADIVHLHHTLPLVADLDGVISALHAILKATGVAVIECSYVKHLIDRQALWTTHTARRNCFSLTSLVNLVARHGLVVNDVELTGEGSVLQAYVGKQGGTSSRVATLLEEERAWGVDRVEAYLPARPAKVA